MFNEDLQAACLDLRGNIFDRFRIELAGIGQIMDVSEDRIRVNVAGMIGARDFRQYEGEVTAGQRAGL